MTIDIKSNLEKFSNGLYPTEGIARKIDYG